MRKQLAYILLALVGFLAACDGGESALRLAIGGESLELTKKEVREIKTSSDATGRELVEVTLTESGAVALTELTTKHVGETMNLYFKDEIVVENLPIQEPLTMEVLHIPVKSEAFAREIENFYMQ